MINTHVAALPTQEQLVTLLKRGELNVTFTKKDGTERVMRCTLQEGRFRPYVPVSKYPRPPKPGIIFVFDLDKKAFRSFYYDSIKKVENIFYPDQIAFLFTKNTLLDIQS